MGLKLAEFSNGTAIIESDLGGPGRWGDAIEELQSPAAKQLAIREATKQGVSGAAVGISGGSYPVDSNGGAIEPTMDSNLIAGYRIEIQVAPTFR